MRAVVEIVKMDLKRIFKSPKLYLLIIFTLYFLRDFTVDIKSLAVACNLGIAPYIYPLFYGESISRMFAMLVIVILMSDAPYIDSSQRYTYIRTGSGKWLLGKVGYVLSISFVYQIIVMIGSVLVLIPDAGFSSDWGDVLLMLGRMSADTAGAYGTQSSITYIEMNYTPAVAMLLTCLLATLVSSLVGMFVFLINGITKSSLGTILALVMSMADMFITAVRQKGLYLKIPNIMSWMNLSSLYTGEHVTGKSGLYNVIIIMIISIVVMAALLYYLIRKSVINVAE